MKLQATVSILSLSAAVVLTGCGGGSTSSTAPSTGTTGTSGVAAVGMPIAGGAVSLKCAGGQTASTTTGATGSWNVDLPAAAYPCAVRLTGGTAGSAANILALHSVAAAPGITNITTLTDLLVARLTGQNPSTWFDSVTGSALSTQITDTAVTAARALLAASLATLPNAPVLPAGFDPLTTVFSATVGNPFDLLLDVYRAALATAGLTHGTVASNAASGQPLNTPSGGSTTVGSVVKLTPLTGSQTYTMLYSSTTIGADIRPVTATFATNETLIGYNASSVEALEIGTMTNAETSGTANLQIGRWNNGAFAGRYYSTVTPTTTLSLTGNQGFHYAIAKAPDVLPCGGTISYNLAAATKPTRSDGSVVPGTLDSLTVAVTFNSNGTQVYKTAGSMTLGGSSLPFSGSPTATAGAQKAFGIGGLTSAGVSDGGAYGAFAGPAAEELGLVLSGLAPGGATALSVRVAARLVKTASTAIACS